MLNHYHHNKFKILMIVMAISPFTTISPSSSQSINTTKHHQHDNNVVVDYYKSYEDDDNVDYEDEEDDSGSAYDDETYRKLFEQILSHPDVILASSPSSTTDTLSSTTSSGNDSSTPTMYHIFIANSTTTIPMIMVTTSKHGGTIHHLRNTLPTSSSLHHQNETSNDYENDGIPEDEDISQAEMIVIKPTNKSDQNVLNQLPPGFLELFFRFNEGEHDDSYRHHLADMPQSTKVETSSIPPTVANKIKPKSDPSPDGSSSMTTTSPITTNVEYDQQKQYKPDHRLRNVIVILCYSTIMFVSLCGNYLVCHVIYSTPKLRTTTNILIFSLTISDIMTTILNIPFNCARFLLGDWPFPDSFCMLMPTVQVTNVYVSSLTMAAICLHRYRSIFGTTSPEIVISSRIGFNHATCSMSRVNVKLWIVLIWFVSVLLALPHTIFNEVGYNNHMIRRCKAKYPESIKHEMRLFLSLLAAITQFLLPLILTSVLYTKIGQIIAHQGKLARHYCDELNRRVVEAKRKRITMLVLIVAGFFITWLPLTFYHLLIDFHLVHFYWNAFLALHIWAMTSVCYNPFIYCFMNEDFRKRTRQIMTRRSIPLCFIMFSSSHLSSTTPVTTTIYRGSVRQAVNGQAGSNPELNSSQTQQNNSTSSSFTHQSPFSFRAFYNQTKLSLNFNNNTSLSECDRTYTCKEGIINHIENDDEDVPQSNHKNNINNIKLNHNNQNNNNNNHNNKKIQNHSESKFIINYNGTIERNDSSSIAIKIQSEDNDYDDEDDDDNETTNCASDAFDDLEACRSGSVASGNILDNDDNNEHYVHNDPLHIHEHEQQSLNNNNNSCSLNQNNHDQNNNNNSNNNAQQTTKTNTPTKQQEQEQTNNQTT